MTIGSLWEKVSKISLNKLFFWQGVLGIVAFALLLIYLLAISFMNSPLEIAIFLFFLLSVPAMVYAGVKILDKLYS